MKPIVICYPTQLNKEVEAINALFEAGLEILHVRKPAYSEADMIAFIDSIDAQYHNRIVVHSHLSIVEPKGLRGVHFTSYNRHLIDDYSNKSLPKSISVHSMSELINLSESFNYALLSPVFESISKEGYGPAIDQTILKKFLSTIHDVKVLALGGIDHKNVDIAKELGFDGVVLHGHLWAQFENDGDIEGVVERFKEVTEKWT
ncbi:thiamine phosphate synthase [Carboxylicivirga mesophila]|uniref:Thiamine phosphate synthase n=1 Tax=Carboxylicivirga mesophila TaxID=1166478 RepID=A0ABS5K8P2_9BACT|nr:thiamine phosphate synthase [Carboxylicivirga mesophila]MBS2211242.1 thiamine phosphate synthase [Carboxylicivirga mesophila]